jgi:DNA-binding LacI/PurR family transcriptional regulator
MSVTIKDVAKAAGVNPSTVSRVIAGNPKISPETCAKVIRAMKDLHYHPNITARNLVNCKSQTLGIVMPRASEDVFFDPFFPEIVRGVCDVAKNAEYDILVAVGNSEEEERASVLKMVHGHRVDGVILLVSRVDDSLGEYLHKHKFPAAIIGRPLYPWDICWADNDNIEAAYNATKYLLEHGHRKIACIINSFEFVYSLDRLEGYKKAFAERGIPFNRDLVGEAGATREGGYKAMGRLLEIQPDITAVLAIDDLVAFGAMLRVKENDLAIPDQISFIGFNNSPVSLFTNPPLTTVDIHIYQLGFRVAELLIEKIQQPAKPAGWEYVTADLVVRNSCRNL